MNSPLFATIWELWRTSRLELLIRLGWQGFVISLIASAFPTSDHAPEQILVGGLLVIFLVTASIASMTWVKELDRGQSGFSFRLSFARPVSSTFLTLVPLFFCVMLAVACYLLPAAVFIFIVGYPLPLLGPAVMIGCTVVCLLAATWCPTTLGGKAIGVFLCFALGGGLFAYAIAHADDVALLAIGRRETYALTAPRIALALVIFVTAVLLTLASVKRQRYGETLLQLPSLRSAERSLTNANRDFRPFANVFTAQLWFEWKRCFSRMTAMAIIVPILTTLFLLVVPMIDSGWRFSPHVWLMVLAISPVVFQFVGVESAMGLVSDNGTATMSPFDLVRPLRNDQILACKAAAVTLVSFLGWLVVLAFVVVHVVATNQWGEYLKVIEQLLPSFDSFSMGWLPVWLACSVVAFASSTSILVAQALSTSLHPIRPTIGFVVLGVHMVVVVLDVRSGWNLERFYGIYAYMIAATIVGASLYVLWRAMSLANLSNGYLAVAIALWVPFAAIGTVACMRVASDHHLALHWILLWLSFLLVPLAATVNSPNAVAAHRHQ